ncbi:hypothetical protein EG68_01548 [Paragonimus skrjabini miyazakii]|uniref:Uncharacterized protein n=1 Tax=Paragonimus skrjabini miyazakii TaxID=59628 RepID=A0A8S9Z6P7_9TREM|nr:hypothetical protein EG68_01548 [Paragonimus skrjabini miyazakii]
MSTEYVKFKPVTENGNSGNENFLLPNLTNFSSGFGLACFADQHAMLWNRLPFVPPIFPPFPEEFNPRVPLTAVTCIIPNESRLGKENEPVVVSSTTVKGRIPVVSMTRPNDLLSRRNGEVSPVCSSETSEFEPKQSTDEYPNSQMTELSSNRSKDKLTGEEICGWMWNHTCAGCQLRIVQKQCLRLSDGQVWHTDCLTCHHCGTSLQTANSCFNRDGSIYCQADYKRLFGPLKRASISCSACQRLVTSRDLVIRAHLYIFHYSCFVCRQCNRSLQPGDRYVLRDGQPVCQADLLLEGSLSPTEAASEKPPPSVDYKLEEDDRPVQDKNEIESFPFTHTPRSRPPSSQRFGIPSPIGKDFQITSSQTRSDRLSLSEPIYPNKGIQSGHRLQYNYRSLSFPTSTNGSHFSPPSICALSTRVTEPSETDMLSHYFLSTSRNPHLDCNIDQQRFTCFPNPTKQSLSELMSALEPYSLQPSSASSPPMIFGQLDVPDPHVPFLSPYLHHSHRSPIESSSGIHLPEVSSSVSSVSSSGVQFPLHQPTSVNSLSTRLLVGPKSFELTFPFSSGLPSQQAPPPGFLKLIEPMNHPLGYVTGSNASSLLMQHVQQKRNRKRRTGLHQSFDSVCLNSSAGFCMGMSTRQKRMRTSFKHHQLRAMKAYFNMNHNPDVKDLKVLTEKTGLSKRVLQVWFQNARAKYRRSMLRQETTASIPVATGTMASSMGSASEMSNPTTALQTSLSDCDSKSSPVLHRPQLETESQSSSTEDGPLYNLDETEIEQLDSIKIHNHRQLVQPSEERTRTNAQPLFGITCLTHDPYSETLAARSRSTSSTTTFDCNYAASSPSSVAYNAFDLSGCRSVMDLCSLNILQS